MKKPDLIAAAFSFCAAVLVMGCYRAPMLTAWTTGEANAPSDIADVYRAVLDEIFPPNSSGPTLVVIEQVAEPSVVEVFFRAKGSKRPPDAVIEPFRYRIPLVFVDTSTWRELYETGRVADSVSHTLPNSDPRRFQAFWAPFMARYPGAWGRLTLGRVAFGPRRDYALVQVRYTSLDQSTGTGQEFFRLAHQNNRWLVVDRVPRDGAPIEARPVPHAMIHGLVDSPSAPPPKRRLVRGTVKDSASGAPIPFLPIRVKSLPLNKQGQMMQENGPVPWGTVFTNSAGEFVIANPPSGYMYVEAVCPPQRDVDGAGLAPATLQPEAGLDTVLAFRVRFAWCAEMAPVMAQEAERHRQDVARAKLEGAARAVQGNIRGTVRDASTGRPVPRVPIRVDRDGPTFSDSLGRFWLWGFAPGKRKITAQCPTRRSFLGGKEATSFSIQAPPRMNDTFDIRINMRNCEDPEVMTATVRTRGVWSVGFEDGFFTPCEPFTQIRLGAYRDWSRAAYLTFAHKGIDPPGGWPDLKPTKGYYKIFLDVEADLVGPGSYGHLGIATYLLKVTRVVSATSATKTSCGESGPIRIGQRNRPLGRKKLVVFRQGL
jgi:hypothetical protein